MRVAAAQSARRTNLIVCCETAVQGLVPQPGDGTDFPRMAAVNVEVLDGRDVIIGATVSAGLVVPSTLTLSQPSTAQSVCGGDLQILSG